MLPALAPAGRPHEATARFRPSRRRLQLHSADQATHAGDQPSRADPTVAVESTRCRYCRNAFARATRRRPTRGPGAAHRAAPGRERFGAGQGRAAADRRVRDGQVRRRVHRLLPVRLRRLAEEDADPGGPRHLEPRLFGDPAAQRGRAAPDPGEEREGGARPRRPVREEGRRFLCNLHGRAQGGDCLVRGVAGRAGQDRCRRGRPVAGQGGRAPASHRGAHVVWIRIAAGFQGRQAGHRRRRPGWVGPAGPRLLPEGRRAHARAARALSRPHREDAGARGRHRGGGEETGQDRDGDRDGDRKGVDGQGGAARSQ